MDHSTALLSHLHSLAISLEAADDTVADSLAALASNLSTAVASYRGLQLTITQHGFPVILTAFTPRRETTRRKTQSSADRGPTDPSQANTTQAANPTQANPSHADRGELDHAHSVGSVVTSLRLPLKLIDAGFEIGSRAVYYASIRGAFVDLAADLTYALTPGGAAPTSAPTRSPESDGDAHVAAIGADGQPAGISLDTDLPPSSRTFGISGLSELSTINRAVGMMIDRGHHPGEVHATLRRHAAAAGLAPHAFALRLLED